MKTISINQPAYLPWLGYFDRIAKSDIHVVLDHVQFEKNSMINRNKILSNGQPLLLTIPVRTSGKLGENPIYELEASNLSWIRKHIASIRQSYSKSPCFTELSDTFFQTYSTDESSNRVIDLLRAQLRFFLKSLKISSEIKYSSDTNWSGTKSDLILDICKKYDADTYLSGPFGRDYLDTEAFRHHNIKVVYQDYQHPVYPQNSENFVPYMSTLDLLMNDKPHAREILTND